LQKALNVSGLSKSVITPNGRLDILKDIHFSINAAESVAIIGASGSGKSTLLSILAGLDSPSEGTVQLNGEQLSGLNEEQRALLRQERIGFVFQSFHLISSLTALDNIMLPLELKGEKKAKEIALSLLE